MPIKLTKTRRDLMLATGGDFSQKLVGYVVLMVLARYLDKGVMGDFFFASALALIVALLAELGTSQFLVREIAKQPERSREYLGSVLALRIPLFVVAFALLNIAMAVVRPEIVSIVALASCYVFLNELFYSFGAFFLGHRRVGLRVVTALSGQLLMIGLVLLAVSQGWGLHAILGCYIFANCVLVLTGYTVVRGVFGPVRITWTRETFAAVRSVLKLSLPMFTVATISLVHFKIDTVMLGFIPTAVAVSKSEEVARYEAAYKIFEVSRVFARPLLMVFLPICAGLVAQAAWPALREKVRRITLLALGAGVALAVAVIALADWVVPLIFGQQYVGSIPVLRVLYLAVPMLYLTVVGMFLCNAMRLERRAVAMMSICLAANVALNAVFIPTHGAMGAAWVTLGTETLMAVLLMAVVIHWLRGRPVEAETPPTEGAELAAVGDGARAPGGAS